MSLNISAVILWVIGGLVGWLIGDGRGAVIDVVCLMSLSVVIAVIDVWRNS